MNEPEPLYIQYDSEPLEIDPTGCRTVAALIKKAKKEFSPQLHSVPLSKLTLNRYTGTKLKGDMKITALINEVGFTNNYDNPLLIRYADTVVSAEHSQEVATDIKPNQPNAKAYFELYAWKATKNPYRTVALDLFDGRIALSPFLKEERIIQLYRMDSDDLVLLLANNDGFSVQKWANNQRYKLKAKAHNHIDIETTFSEKDPEKMNLLNVRDDFNIQFDDTPWECSIESIRFPDALYQALALFAEYNTLRLEQSRRFIVSLFLHFAISTVPEGKSKLYIDEETPLSIVRNVIREGEPKTVKYSGPVDFVIGHSKMVCNMPKDAAVIVTKTKETDTFGGSLAQVTAQAAALLFFRRGMKPPRGSNGSGGPIIFIRTDGERWIFSKMTCEEGVPIVQHSDEFTINIRRNTIEDATVHKVFDWLRYAIIIGRDSTPRASMEQITQEQNDEEIIDAGFFS